MLENFRANVLNSTTQQNNLLTKSKKYNAAKEQKRRTLSSPKSQIKVTTEREQSKSLKVNEAYDTLQWLPYLASSVLTSLPQQ